MTTTVLDCILTKVFRVINVSLNFHVTQYNEMHSFLDANGTTGEFLKFVYRPIMKTIFIFKCMKICIFVFLFEIHPSINVWHKLFSKKWYKRNKK